MYLSSFFLLAVLAAASAGQPYTDQQAYLAQLLAQLAQMQTIVKDIELLNLSLDQNIRIANQEASQRRLRIGALDDAHQLALDLWEQVFVNNHHKTWNCPSIKKEHYQSFQKQLHLLNTTAQQNIITLNTEKYCLRNQRMIFYNSFVSRTMRGLELELVQTCQKHQQQLMGLPFLDTSQTKNYPNLNTQSAWTYGKITPQQYQTKINELSHIFNAVPCPIDSPFLDKDNQCFRCQKDGEVYDLSMKQCKLCEGECVVNGGRFNNNQRGQNYIGNRIDLSLVSNCPEHSPFYNGERCISCNLPLYFSFSSLKCQACAEETGFDLKAKQCVSNIFFVSYSGELQNYIGGPYSAPPLATVKRCSQSQPYSNGKTCTRCALPNFYNYHTGQCQSCPAGLIFNIGHHSCGGGPGAKINSNLIGSRNFMGRVPVFQRIYGVCPLKARFFNGMQCITCQLPHFYNFSSLKCQSCPMKQVFDLSVQACVAEAQSYVTNLNNPNIYYNGNFDIIVSSINTSKSKGAKQCTLGQPFYDPKTDKCKACPINTPLFDIRRGNCFGCPGGSRFEPKARICLSNQVSPSIERMIMNGFL